MLGPSSSPVRELHTTISSSSIARHGSHGYCWRERILSSDNGPEMVTAKAEEFFAKLGVQHEKSAPHSQNQNGTAERGVRDSSYPYRGCAVLLEGG
eukprot:2300773-Rhodomonas_salina.1